MMNADVNVVANILMTAFAVKVAGADRVVNVADSVITALVVVVAVVMDDAINSSESGIIPKTLNLSAVNQNMCAHSTLMVGASEILGAAVNTITMNNLAMDAR
jgi:hypothetical protein